MTPSQGLIDNMAPHTRVVFFVFIHGVFGAFFMIMIFLAAVLCPFFLSLCLFSSCPVELLNGLTSFCLVFIVTSRFSSANCFIDFLFYFVFFLQVKLF